MRASRATTSAPTPVPVERLDRIEGFGGLMRFLREELRWPVEYENYLGLPVDVDDTTFAFDNVEAGVSDRVRALRWFRPDALPGCPWAVAILETHPNPDRPRDPGLRVKDLRALLRQMNPAARMQGKLPAKRHDETLFIVTPDYHRFTFAHFRGEKPATARISTFGWEPALPKRTVADHCLPHLRWPANNVLQEPAWDTVNWSKAFDVGAITDKFFADFHGTFNRISEVVGAASPGVSGEDLHRFTLTLMNRMMFCWFIQQKGWLGHEREYLSRLWEQANPSDTARFLSDDGFYREMLRPLFFHMLNTPWEDRDPAIVERMGEIPYLNGGLFEEGDLDQRTDIRVPNRAIGLLLHLRPGEDHLPRGLFLRWNFTVEESTPQDVQVAVDPEMLGKVFEELMNEVTGARGDTRRHEMGAYYTPRPIVRFMCREALKGFLGGHEALVDDRSVDAITVSQARSLLGRLAEVKVVDPACGSGAYLLGMLQELHELTLLLDTRAQLEVDRAHYEYSRKLAIIQHNLYGVDLERSAVEIARLRLWLSLAVDFEDHGNLRSVPALPNLVFKIEHGDSLSAPDPQGVGNLFWKEAVPITDEMRQLKDKHVRASDPARRHALQEEIENRRAALVKLFGGAALPDNAFDWRVRFGEVFITGTPAATLDGRFAFANEVQAQQSFLDADTATPAPAGFDIVLANPPYVRMELFKDQKPVLRANFPQVHAERADLYCYFYARAIQLLRPGGMLAFISSNKWLRAGYGANLREHVAATTSVQCVVDFGELPVFQQAATYPMVIVARKGSPTTSIRFAQVPSLDEPYPDVLAVVSRYGHDLDSTAIRSSDWRLSTTTSANILRTMDANTVPLGRYVNGRIYRGVVTGLNQAFLIDGATRDLLIEANPEAEQVIRPCIIGDDVAKWKIESHDRWLLYMRHGVGVSGLRSVLNHLRVYRDRLEQRATKQEWYELQQPQSRFMWAFEGPKILYQEIATHQGFAFDTTGAITNNKVFMIPTEDLFLLGVLNSAAAWLYLKETAGRLQGGAVALQALYVSVIPIPDAPAAEREKIAELVQRCLDARGVGCEEWEAEINDRVARLYGI